MTNTSEKYERTQQALSDETKKFHRDRYRDFFSRPNIFETDTETFFRDQMFSRPIPRLFFETKYFRDRYRDFFSKKSLGIGLENIWSQKKVLVSVSKTFGLEKKSRYRSLKSLSKVSQKSLKRVSKVAQKSLKSRSKVSQKSLKSLSKVPQRSLKSLSKVSQKSLKGLSKVSQR